MSSSSQDSKKDTLESLAEECKQAISNFSGEYPEETYLKAVEVTQYTENDQYKIMFAPPDHNALMGLYMIIFRERNPENQNEDPNDIQAIVKTGKNMRDIVQNHSDDILPFDKVYRAVRYLKKSELKEDEEEDYTPFLSHQDFVTRIPKVSDLWHIKSQLMDYYLCCLIHNLLFGRESDAS